MAGSTNYDVLNNIIYHGNVLFNSVGDLGYIYALNRDLWALARVVGKYGGSTVYISEYQYSLYCRVQQLEYGDHKRQAWLYRCNDNVAFDWTESQKKGSAEWNCFQMNKATIDHLKAHGYRGIQDMGVDGMTAGEMRDFDSANHKPTTDWQYYWFCMRWGTYYVRFYK